ncbi:MAG: site-specific integrase [Anaerolineae bacterium]|nr:site-specific integrase [Anaerolineae bacterium]
MDPTAHLKRPSAPRRDRGTVKYIPSGEIKAIKDAAKNVRDLALVTMFEQTGARASELAGLTWGKVNLKQRRFIVTGRFDKTRVVFFKRDGAKIMRAYRNTVPHTSDDPVFWRIDRSEPLTYWGIYQVLERLAARAGVARFNPHAFRHAFGVRLSLSGCPTVVLQDLMGHVSPATTKIYTEFNDDQLQKAYDLYA